MSRWEWISVLFCSIAVCFIFGFYFLKFWGFYEGLQNLKNKEYIRAEENFLKVLSQSAQNFPARLNLALTKFLKKDFESALKEYGKVGKESPNSLERFHSFFNSGHIYSQKEDKERALDFYQKALDEKSDSLEVKTNIELMFQKSHSQDSKDQSSEDQRDSKDSSESKEGESQSSLNKGLEKGEINSSDSKSQQGQSQEGDSTELSSEQVQFILKEIESKEQELKMRLYKQPKDNQQRKKW